MYHFSNGDAQWDLAEFSVRSARFFGFERPAGNTWSVVSGTDWDAAYVFKIGAFETKPAVELVCIISLFARLKFGAAY
jgi:hypothetical protein